MKKWISNLKNNINYIIFGIITAIVGFFADVVYFVEWIVGQPAKSVETPKDDISGSEAFIYYLHHYDYIITAFIVAVFFMYVVLKKRREYRHRLGRVNGYLNEIMESSRTLASASNSYSNKIRENRRCKELEIYESYKNYTSKKRFERDYQRSQNNFLYTDKECLKNYLGELANRLKIIIDNCLKLRWENKNDTRIVIKLVKKRNQNIDPEINENGLDQFVIGSTIEDTETRNILKNSKTGYLNGCSVDKGSAAARSLSSSGKFFKNNNTSVLRLETMNDESPYIRGPEELEGKNCAKAVVPVFYRADDIRKMEVIAFITVFINNPTNLNIFRLNDDKPDPILISMKSAAVTLFGLSDRSKWSVSELKSKYQKCLEELK